MAGEAHQHHLLRRLAERRAAHRRRGKAYRVAFVLAGFTITGVGVILLITPGPALVVLPIGLAMLALEFAWAERMLHHAIVRADAAKQRAASTSRVERALGAVATALAIAAIVAAGVLWDLPLLPL
jgi:uncharacterized protein (TIGR02611 family)